MAEPKPTFAELLAQYEESRPKALDERFTQPVSPEAGPFQQIIPEEETYRDMAERNLAAMLGDDRQAFRRAGKLLDTADQLPILGDASAGIDVIQAIKDVDPVGIGIGALGMIPGVNRAAVRKALDEKIRNVRNFFGGQTPDQPEIDVRQLNTVSKPMSERLIRAQYMGFDTTKPYYHGTAGVKNKKGKKSEGIEEFESKHGSFFSESPDVAATYAVGREGHSTYPVFLNKTEYIRFRPAKKDIESSSYGAKTGEGFVEKGEAGTPFYYYNRIPRAGMLVDLPDGTTRKLSDVFPKLKPSLLAGGRITNTDELAKAAKKAGYKGIIIEDVLDIGAGTTMPVNPKKLLEANEVVVAIDPTTIRSVNAEFDPAAKDSAEILKAKGGMVTNMNRPVMSRGLSNLIRNYSQGPLARLDVPRETVPMQTMNGGGPVGGRYEKYNPFSGDEPLEDLNRAQTRLISQGLLQTDDLQPDVLRDAQDGPASPPINTGNQFIASDPTVPFTFPPVEEQTTTTQPTQQTTTPPPPPPTTPPVEVYGTPPQQPTDPNLVGMGRTPDQVMADRAAEEAAAAEAERIRLANLAGQQQLAAEQLAAQQQVVQDNVVPVLGEEPTAVQTLDQALAQELADQATTQLAAQQNLDTQVLGAEQLVDQQAADRALLEAQLANQDDPTAVFQAPALTAVDRSSFGVPPAEGTQVIDPNAPNFLVADMIDPYTTGYAPTLGMNIKETVYPYQGMTQEEMEEQGVYRGQVFQPMPKLGFGDAAQEGGEGEDSKGTGTATGQTGSGMPAIDFGSTTSGGGTKGRYITLPTGQSVFVPDYGDMTFNTENAESEMGQYGLGPEQRYQCPGYYTLAFEGGQPYCKKIDKSQWPSGGRPRVRVANLPSRTDVSIIDLQESGAQTGEGYAQGGAVGIGSLI